MPPYSCTVGKAIGIQITLNLHVPSEAADDFARRLAEVIGLLSHDIKAMEKAADAAPPQP